MRCKLHCLLGNEAVADFVLGFCLCASLKSLTPLLLWTSSDFDLSRKTLKILVMLSPQNTSIRQSENCHAFATCTEVTSKTRKSSLAFSWKSFMKSVPTP